MDTGLMQSTEGNGSSRAWRSSLLAVSALVLSLLLLGACFTSLASAESQPAPLAQGGDFDLKIVKSQVPTVFTVGSNNKYIISVSRVNTETITVPPSIEDVLPTGMTVSSISATDWDCTASSSIRVSCVYLPSIPASLVNFPTIVVNVTVASTVNPVVTNTAQLYPGFPSNPDLDPTNNAYTVTTTVNSADLEISKIANPHIATVGSPILYTIVITNNGPSGATDVRLTDVWPSTYLSYDGCDGCGASVYHPTTGILDLPDLIEGGEHTIYLHGTTLAASDGVPIVNTAKVSSSNFSDWKSTNNSDSDTIVVGGPEITKTVTTASASVGQQFGYTIHVYNNTAQALTNVTIRDVFTTTLDIVSCTVHPVASTCNLSGRTLTQYVNNVPASGHVWIDLKVKANTTMTDARYIKNTAAIQWGPTTSRITSYSNTVSTYVLPSGILKIRKRDNVASVDRSEVFTYTITLTNTGSLPVSNIRFTETVPAKLSAVSFNSTKMDAVGFTTGGCDTDTGVCIWRRSELIDPGEVISFKMRARVSTTATGNIVNHVAVSALDTGDGHRVVASAEETTKIVIPPSEATIKVGLDVSPYQTRVGQKFTFRVVVRNKGSTTATNAKLTDVFPTFLDLSASNVKTTRGTITVNLTSHTVTTDIGDIAGGKGVTVTIVTQINSTAVADTKHTHEAKLTWGTGSSTVSTVSNEVTFRIRPAAVLPGTGWGPGGAISHSERVVSNAQRSISAPPAGRLRREGALLSLAGVLVLGGVLYSQQRRSRRAARFWRLFLLALMACVLLSLAACAPGQAPPPATQSGLLQRPNVSSPTPTGARPSDLAPTATATVAASAAVDSETPEALVTSEEDVVLPTEVDLTPDATDPGWEPPLPTATPLRLPDYPVPTPTLLPTAGPNGGPPDVTQAIRLIIPSMGLDTVVKYVPFNGDTWLIGGLKQEVAWMGDTSWPGIGGNTGLAGHVDLYDGSNGPFWNLKNLQPGDLVMLYTEKNVYTYKVRQQVVVDEDAMSVVSPTDKAQVTLITCTSWDPTIRAYLQRLIVYADFVEAKPV